MIEYKLKLGEKIDAELILAAAKLGVNRSEAIRRAVLLLNLAAEADRIELWKGDYVREVCIKTRI
jgi:Ribbon-helix-helix protein, copG family